MLSADFCKVTKSPYGNSCPFRDTLQISPGKANRFHRTPARYTLQSFDGYGLRDAELTRPDCPASYLISVRQVTVLLHTSFRHYLTIMPLCFTNASLPSRCVEDFHLPAISHAGHTQTRVHLRSSSSNYTCPIVVGLFLLAQDHSF